MVFQSFSLPQCSTRSMCYMLFSISLCVVLHVWMLQRILDFVDNVGGFISSVKLTRLSYQKQKPTKTKYIHIWDNYYLITNKNGESHFPALNCPVNNCHFTGDKNLLDDYTKYDAVVFGDGILKSEVRPKERGPSQIYVFTTIESSYNVAACEVYNDNFFNWTFTFRLDSDVLWTYFIVRNTSGALVAPSADVAWKENSKPLRPKIKSILRRKRKAAAWIVSHCHADSFRDDYLTRLQQHLYHFSLHIDVYGICSKAPCTHNSCDEMLKQNYRFYMAFENSFAEDYVTEKVLKGYRNYAVPVVYGGANYSRFLPPGSYINARKTHPYNLAFAIYEAMKNPSVFESYFKWTNTYSVEQWGPRSHPLCNLCAALNEKRANHAPAKKNFRLWWNTLNGMKWCLPEAYWNETALINLEAQSIFNQY